MADVDNDLEATRQKEEKEAKERERQEKEKWNKAPALGKRAGGKLHKGTILGAEYLGEQYVGIGPLAVPCTRGEQKALTGDVIVTLWLDRPEPEDDVEIIFIVPGEMVKTSDFLTNAEYDSFLKSREEKLERKSKKADKALPSAPVAAGTENRSPSAPTTQTRPRS